MSLTLFSQKPVSIEGDTLICFSIPQSKYLLKQVYLLNESDTLLKLTEAQLSICKSKNFIYTQQIEAFQKIIENEKEINKNVLAINTQKDEDIKNLKTQLANQKLKTWASIFSGFVTTAFVSYLYIKK